MFIKLTRLDNSPIWLNASFIVTVEPRKGGGTIVVPIGDGLDYEVREKAEVVLQMLDGAPVPAVVPVPTSDGLAPTPDDVSPEPERPEPVVPARAFKPVAPAPAEPEPVAAAPADPAPAAEEVAVAEPEPEKPTRKRTTRKTATKTTAKTTKTATKTRKRTTKKAEAEEAPVEPSVEPPPAEPEPEPVVEVTPPISLTEVQIERLRRMMPRSVRKLSNTLIAQFRVDAPEPVIEELMAHGVVRLDGDRVFWS